jgi:hypothetical protein
MSELARVVPLMYRPRWPELTLSGQVSSYDKAGPHFEAFERRGRLWLAPGGRYRADLADEDGDRSLDICDGQSLWVAMTALLVAAV